MADGGAPLPPEQTYYLDARGRAHDGASAASIGPDAVAGRVRVLSPKQCRAAGLPVGTPAAAAAEHDPHHGAVPERYAAVEASTPAAVGTSGGGGGAPSDSAPEPGAPPGTDPLFPPGEGAPTQGPDEGPPTNTPKEPPSSSGPRPGGGGGGGRDPSVPDLLLPPGTEPGEEHDPELSGDAPDSSASETAGGGEPHADCPRCDHGITCPGCGERFEPLKDSEAGQMVAGSLQGMFATATVVQTLQRWRAEGPPPGGGAEAVKALLAEVQRTTPGVPDELATELGKYWRPILSRFVGGGLGSQLLLASVATGNVAGQMFLAWSEASKKA